MSFKFAGLKFGRPPSWFAKTHEECIAYACDDVVRNDFIVCVTVNKGTPAGLFDVCCHFPDDGSTIYGTGQGGLTAEEVEAFVAKGEFSQ